MSGIVDPDLINDLEEIQPTFGEANCYDDYVFIPRGHHPEVCISTHIVGQKIKKSTGQKTREIKVLEEYFGEMRN